ncbi:MAG: putative transport system ATP-binding protein [Cryptosporangiaceae bacterium]|nr:putative transport system ATP-binding protein [Cryptosporangiaceae bacterium]
MTAPSGETAIAARDLYRFFRAGDEETLALRGISLSVAPGERLVVAGPSGSGKSTLLACLAGLDEPDGGSVWIAGARMSHRPEAERSALRASRVGVLYQQGNLLGHLTIAQNLQLVRRLGRGRRARANTGAAPTRTPWDVLDAVGLANRSGAYPAELSGGEAARAGLAVALANNPAVLIADEPTGELDSATERRLLALLGNLARAGTAMVIASHSPAVLRTADTALHLRDGSAVAA